MKIKPILARLQDAIGIQDIFAQMVLLPEPTKTPANFAKSTQSLNLVVGYNSSSGSQAALDIALLIAHQTRVATQKQVTVHVVYVLDDTQSQQLLDAYQADLSKQLMCPLVFTTPSTTSVLTQPTALSTPAGTMSNASLERADLILWQARCLAEEWKGTFVAHLRFGGLCTELSQVVESEAADLLLLGCNSPAHPLVKQLSSNLPCAVLGIPTSLGVKS